MRSENFRSYIQCVFLFSFVGAVVMYILGDNRLFVESVGFMAVFVEACLGVPQFLRNYKNRSTKGMKYVQLTHKKKLFKLCY